jgi:hypothetical protein
MLPYGFVYNFVTFMLASTYVPITKAIVALTAAAVRPQIPLPLL